MGVSIHYRGRLDDISMLSDLINELSDIANSMGWEQTQLDDDWSEPPDACLHHTSTGAHIQGNLGLKGIEISPGSGGEPLSFYFNCDGELRSVMGMLLILEGTVSPANAWTSVKTQFVSPDVHVWMIGLLKYLQKRYISNLEVSDEGEYWETGKLDTLYQRRQLIDDKIEQLSGALSSNQLGDIKNMTPEQIATKIEQLLLDKDTNL